MFDLIFLTFVSFRECKLFTFFLGTIVGILSYNISIILPINDKIICKDNSFFV